MPSSIAPASPSWIRDLVAPSSPSTKRPHPYARPSLSLTRSFSRALSPEACPALHSHRSSFSSASSGSSDMDSSPTQSTFPSLKITNTTPPSWSHYGMDRASLSASGPLSTLRTVGDALLSPLEARSVSLSSANSSNDDYFGDYHGTSQSRTSPSEDEDAQEIDEFESAESKKTRRGRILMDPMQSKHLFALWKITYFPSTTEREELAKVSGLSARQVQVWFQNQRQKQRRVLHDPLATEADKAKLGDLRHSPRTRRKLTLASERVDSPSATSSGLQLITSQSASSSRPISPYPFAFSVRSSVHSLVADSAPVTPSSTFAQPRPLHPRSLTNVPALESSADNTKDRSFLSIGGVEARRTVSAGPKFFFGDSEGRIDLPAIGVLTPFSVAISEERRNSFSCFPSTTFVDDEQFSPRPKTMVRLPSFAEMFGGI